MNTLSSARILCIEDNPINWRLVRRLLGQAGFEVHWAKDGIQGFEMALALRPDLVLLDINLPGLSGFETATKFRQQPELRATPIVALTAKTLKSDRETALVAGCDGFIPKPIDPFGFVGQVRSYLGGQREQVESGKEGPILRSLSAQMVEHLEAQLRAAQEANAKLMEAQADLEARNRSLARIVDLSQGLLTEHDPGILRRRILEQIQVEMKARSVRSYWSHASRAYLEGSVWHDESLERAPVLPGSVPFCRKVLALEVGEAVDKPQLQAHRLWEDGAALGLWPASGEACLIPVRDSQDQEGRWGFFCIARPEPFLPQELEMFALFTSLAQVSRENVDLIASLTESSRALASSYESMERAYQDLHSAKAELNRQERRIFMEDLFHKITQRLQAPVAVLWEHGSALAGMLPQGEEEMVRHVASLSEAVRQIDHLVKALTRRVAQEDLDHPEWLVPKEIFLQELELLSAEGVIPSSVEMTLDDQGTAFQLFGVYADFSRVLQFVVQHAVGGPTPTGTLVFRTWIEGGYCCFSVQDEGGAIPPMGIEAAFEPFSALHQDAIIDVRTPGANLPSVAQILTTYRGTVSIRNEGDGTVVTVSLPMG